MSDIPAGAAAHVAAIRAALAAAADPAAAPAMRAYMRDQFPFLGVSAPRRTAALRAAVADLPPLDEAGLAWCARRLWDEPEREHQYAALWLVRRRIRAVGPGFLPVAEELITTKPWWDTVDELAQNIVGPIVLAHPEERARMDRWLGSGDLWLARSAVLHQNKWKGRTDADWLFAACTARSGDRDFFMRKAIGWALREYARTDPDAVRRYVAAHHDQLSALSRTEALRRIGA